MADLKSFIASYKSTGHKFVPYVTDDNNLSELDSTRVLQINLCAIQLLLKSNSLVFLWYEIFFVSCCFVLTCVDLSVNVVFHRFCWQ